MIYDIPKRRSASLLASLASLLVANLVGCGGGTTSRRDASADRPVGASDGAVDGLASASNRDASVDRPHIDVSDGNADSLADADSGAGYAYNNCFFTTLLQVPGGGGLLNHGGGMTLGQSGPVLLASYGGTANPIASLEFAPTSSTSATLLPGQETTNISVPCAPLEFTPTVAQLASGSLTYNAGTVFLSVEGTAEPVDAGNGCSNAGGLASVFVTCNDDAGGLPRAAIDAGAGDGGSSGSGFVGVYSCKDSETSYRAAPGGLESGSGGMGTLTITETGSVLTAAYADDSLVEGSLQFVPTTDSTAVPATSNETMQVFCVGSPVPPDGGYISPTLVTASTLTIDGNWVVLSFVGSMSPSSSCAGVTTSVSVLCAK
jgi:hypothetical protein